MVVIFLVSPFLLWCSSIKEEKVFLSFHCKWPMMGVHWGKNKKHEHAVQSLSVPVGEGALQGWQEPWQEVVSPPPSSGLSTHVHSLIVKEGQRNTNLPFFLDNKYIQIFLFIFDVEKFLWKWKRTSKCGADHMVCYLKHSHLNFAGNVTELIRCGLKYWIFLSKDILKTT